MRLNPQPDVRVTVAALPALSPPRIRLTVGPLIVLTFHPDEALVLADRIVDCVEELRAGNGRRKARR